MKRIRISNSPGATEALGVDIAHNLDAGSIVALYGELGTGKTVLTRGIARGLSIDDHISSPTFIIVQKYQGREWQLYHIDLYRINGGQEAMAMGIGEILADARAIKVIEWAERIQDQLPQKRIDLYLKHETQKSRCIEIILKK